MSSLLSLGLCLLSVSPSPPTHTAPHGGSARPATAQGHEQREQHSTGTDTQLRAQKAHLLVGRHPAVFSALLPPPGGAYQGQAGAASPCRPAATEAQLRLEGHPAAHTGGSRHCRRCLHGACVLSREADVWCWPSHCDEYPTQVHAHREGARWTATLDGCGTWPSSARARLHLLCGPRPCCAAHWARWPHARCTRPRRCVRLLLLLRSRGRCV